MLRLCNGLIGWHCFFFFSSRRRHTRFDCDWSSDVCSSDLRYVLGANTDACEIERYFNSFKYEAFPWLKNIHRDAHAQPFAALGKAWKAYFKDRKSVV